MSIEVGLIGCGAIAESHRRALVEQDACHVLACADVKPEVARRFALQYEIPHTFTDGESLLRLDELDLVVVATPPKWHAELVLRALELDKHVLVEKPLAMNLAEADAMVAAAAQSDRIVGVVLMHRYLPVYHAVRDLVQSGALGTLRLVRLSLGRNMYGDSRFTTPHADPRAWLVDSNIAGGGILMSSSIHFFSVVSYLLGDPVAKQVTGRVRQLHPDAFSRIEDDIDLQVQWDNGVEYVLRESWVTDMPYRGELIGDDGQLVLEGESIIDLSLRAESQNPLPPPYEALLRDGPITGELLQTIHSTPLLFAGLWTDLLESVRDGSHRPRLPSMTHARNMQAIVTAAYQAEATGQPCSVDWLRSESYRTA